MHNFQDIGAKNSKKIKIEFIKMKFSKLSEEILRIKENIVLPLVLYSCWTEIDRHL
jgi:hypothetical protein